MIFLEYTFFSKRVAMAHIPTLRTLSTMKVKEIPYYLSSNASLSNFNSFLRDSGNYYYAKFLSKPKVQPFWHIMAFCRYDVDD